MFRLLTLIPAFLRSMISHDTSPDFTPGAIFRFQYNLIHFLKSYYEFTKNISKPPDTSVLAALAFARIFIIAGPAILK